ncbi:MAG: 6-bladed beta-propeller [Candidatus Marinimicrobia bacterium]|nr:6-bladed beta-propeller [Candidatus Neomarinimicrobiota bacterium]
MYKLLLNTIIFILLILLSSCTNTIEDKTNINSYDTLKLSYSGNRIFPEMPSITFIDSLYYISDGKNCKIYKLNYELKTMNRFGRKGRGPGEFMLIKYILSTNSKLYALSGGNNVLNIYTLNGKFLKAVRLKKEFFNCKLAIDHHENIYFPDPESDKLIKKINKDGKILDNFGELINRKGEKLFNRNLGHLLIKKNNIYFIPLTDPKLLVFNLKGGLIKKINLINVSDIYRKTYRSNLKLLEKNEFAILNDDVCRTNDNIYILTHHFKRNSNGWNTGVILRINIKDKIKLDKTYILSSDGSYNNILVNNNKIYLSDILSNSIHIYRIKESMNYDKKY